MTIAVDLGRKATKQSIVLLLCILETTVSDTMEYFVIPCDFPARVCTCICFDQDWTKPRIRTVYPYALSKYPALSIKME